MKSLLPTLALLAGCASPRLDATALRDTPDHFVVGTPQGSATTEPVAEAGCRNPMVDPRDGTRLTLTRSADGRGDYEVPRGRYGVPPRHLLRLDCASGRPLGVVQR